MNVSPVRKDSRTIRRALLISLTSAGLAGPLLPMAAHAADDWPAKPITVIVPYTPGGATDTVTRIVMEKLSTRLGANIVVENRPGANSTLGAGVAAKAKPDGYTFLSILPAYVVNTHLYKLSYSPSQLEPVVHMADLPLFLFVAKDVPANNLNELVTYARANPDKLTYGSSGNGSSAHLTGADFALHANIKMTHVAYKGSAPILTDLLSGRVSMTFDPILVPMQYVKQDKLKVFAVTSTKRWPTEPDVPTLEEAGFPGVNTGSWVGLLAPAGTPKPIVDRMAKEISEIVREPDVKNKFQDAGFLPTGSTPANFEALMEKDSASYARIIKEANITLN